MRQLRWDVTLEFGSRINDGCQFGADWPTVLRGMVSLPSDKLPELIPK